MDGLSTAVIDYGSKSIRAGTAHASPLFSDEPRIVLPSSVICRSQGQDQVRFPVQEGKIVNYDDFEALIHHILYDSLGWQYGYEGQVLLGEPLLTSRIMRETVTQLMFEVFNVNGFFVQDQAVLALYAVGKASGIVVDIGESKSDIACVIEGQTHGSSIRRVQLSGSILTQTLRSKLEARGMKFRSQRDIEFLKESCCHCCESEVEYQLSTSGVALGTSTNSGQQQQHGTGQAKSYKLPDGQEVLITSEGLELAEMFFSTSNLPSSSSNPGSINSGDLPAPIANSSCTGSASASGAALDPVPSLVESTLDSVYSLTELSFKRLALEGLFACGGGACIPGLSARLLKEIRAGAPPALSPALCMVPEYMPAANAVKYASWMGGAVLARVMPGLGQFVTKAEYDEFGPCVVHRKCS